MFSTLTSRKASVIAGFSIIFLVIVDLLMTRQILSYNNNTEAIMFILTVVIGYGIGSFVLLGFTKRVSEEIRSKSRFHNLTFWTMAIVQFFLLGLLLVVFFTNTTEFLSPLVFAVSSAVASIIMGGISYKFLLWYRLRGYKNYTLLFYGIAAILLATSIAQEGFSKLLLIQVIKEKTTVGVPVESSFLYESADKYNGEIQYKVMNPETTTLYILPYSNIQLYVGLASTVIPIAFAFRWLASTTLLRSFYQTLGRLPIWLWIVLSLPLVFYLIGKMPGFLSGESLAGVDEEYRYYFRLLFRIGNVCGNILFGLAFFMVARRVTSPKLKDYLTIAAIGDILVGLALSTSALQQTYGIAGHSLVLLASYLFSMGLYLSAVALSQDTSLRKLMKTSAVKLMDDIGSAQMEQQLEQRVSKIVKKEQKKLEEQTGGFSVEVNEDEIKEYMKMVLSQRKSENA